MKLKVIGWTDYDDCRYPEGRSTPSETAAIVDELREHGYIFGGPDHQECSGCAPILNDGTISRFSCRGWGGVMALAANPEGVGQYGYMQFYMNDGVEKPVHPSGIYALNERPIKSREELAEMHELKVKDGIYAAVLQGGEVDLLCQMPELATARHPDDADIGDYILLTTESGGKVWTKVTDVLYERRIAASFKQLEEGWYKGERGDSGYWPEDRIPEGKKKISILVKTVQKCEPPVQFVEKAFGKDFIVEGGVLVRYIGRSEQVTVPDGIIAVGEFAFYGNTSIKEVTLPDSVKRVATCAFERCPSLKRVSGGGVQIISSYAFARCESLEEANFLAARKIYSRAFAYCKKLKSALNAGLLYLAHYAYFGCEALKELTVPSGMYYLGYCAFANCGRLTKVTLEGEPPQRVGFDAFRGAPVEKERWMLEEDYSDYDDYDDYDDEDGEVEEDKPVADFDDEPFGDEELDIFANRGIYCYEGGLTVENGRIVATFSTGAENKKVTAPDGVTKIEDYALFCYKCGRLVLPDGVKGINNNALYGADIEELEVCADCKVAADFKGKVIKRSK